MTESHPEYRAAVTCLSRPCRGLSCAATGGGTDVVNHPDGPFASRQDALNHGRAMAHNVYGASDHRVDVQVRFVTEWAFETHAVAAAPAEQTAREL